MEDGEGRRDKEQEEQEEEAGGIVRELSGLIAIVLIGLILLPLILFLYLGVHQFLNQ